MALPKADEAFRNIGEVSAYLGVKKHVLRFWEQKFPQLRPMKRGGGRRLYRPSDVQLLRGIRDLLHVAGYTIKGVQKILRDHGVERVKLAGDGVPLDLADGDKPDPARRAIPKQRPVPLTGVEIQALRTVVAELGACQALLAPGIRKHSGGQRERRAVSHG
jgi:DNA-binding transcriptional MerR regulator